MGGLKPDSGWERSGWIFCCIYFEGRANKTYCQILRKFNKGESKMTPRLSCHLLRWGNMGRVDRAVVRCLKHRQSFQTLQVKIQGGSWI